MPPPPTPDNATAEEAAAAREQRRLERIARREQRARARRRRWYAVAALALVAGGALATALFATTWGTGRHHVASRASPSARPTTSSAAPSRPPPSRGRRAPQRPTVTFIGDSVADEIAYLASARALLAQGVRLRLDLAPCRRLVVPSCFVAGAEPATALALAQSRRRSLGSIVIVGVGYNDFALRFGADAQRVLAALRARHVRTILWLTLRADRHPYLIMNDAIRALAARSPDVVLVDWNRYSRSHRSWFKADGLHLTPAGATAMATLLHRVLVERRAPRALRTRHE